MHFINHVFIENYLKKNTKKNTFCDLTPNMGRKNCVQLPNGFVKFAKAAIQQDPPGWKMSVQLTPCIASGKHLLMADILLTRSDYIFK